MRANLCFSFFLMTFFALSGCENGASSNELTSQSAAAKSAPLQKVKAVSAGPQHACATKESGETVCWGMTGPQKEPLEPAVSQREGIKYFFESSFTRCEVKDNDLAFCKSYREAANPNWQRDLNVEFGPVKKISAGEFAVCAIKTDDTVACFKSETDKSMNPPTDLGKVKSIAVGMNTACAVRMNGELVCWGSRYVGRPDVAIPADLGLVKKIFADDFLLCAIQENDEVRCWAGMSGDRRPPKNLGKVKDLAFGGDHGCAIALDDSVKCWGRSALPPAEIRARDGYYDHQEKMQGIIDQVNEAAGL